MRCDVSLASRPSVSPIGPATTSESSCDDSSGLSAVYVAVPVSVEGGQELLRTNPQKVESDGEDHRADCQYGLR